MTASEGDGASTIRQPSFDSYGAGGDDDAGDFEGDYSSRMEDLLTNGSDSESSPGDTDDDEGFVYTGKDAVDLSGNYGEQLQEILGSEPDEDFASTSDSEMEVERSLLLHDDRDEREDPVLVRTIHP